MAILHVDSVAVMYVLLPPHKYAPETDGHISHISKVLLNYFYIWQFRSDESITSIYSNCEAIRGSRCVQKTADATCGCSMGIQISMTTLITIMTTS